MRALLVSVVLAQLEQLMVDGEDPLKNIEFLQPAGWAPASLLQRNMRTAAEGVKAKSHVAHKMFAEQWKKQMSDIDQDGTLTAPQLKMALGLAKAQMLSLIQKTSVTEMKDEPQTEDETKFYQGMRLGIVRFMCDVDAVNLLEPYATSAGDVAKFVGSGFIVKNDDKGPLIVTNAHVVNDAADVHIQFPSNGQQPYKAQPILVNHDWDIAIVRIMPEEQAQLQKNLDEKSHTLPVFKLVEDTISSGMDVTAMGFPLGSESCAVTQGIISGQESVGGNVCYQSTAPISPGNSGGPLFKKGTDEVAAINFAAASAENAQNVNYAIPSWRVAQVLKHLEAHADTHNVESCGKDPVSCDMDVPKANAVTVPGDKALYTAYGCASGVLVTKVADRSLLSHADPPIEVDSFITSVNGIHLDRFGMGVDDKYVQDPVHYHDLMFMNRDLASSPATVKTCSCGGTETEHTVNLEWKAEYASNIPETSQPFLANLDFEVFGELTIQPMNMPLAKALVMQAGMLNLVDYVIDVDHPPALIVTSAPDPIDMNGAVLQTGSIVAKVNGKKVSTLKEFRAAFEPDAVAECKASSGAAQSDLQTDKPQIFTIQTQDGAFYGAPFKETLAEMLKNADADHPVTKTSREAAEKLGLDVSKISFMEGAVPAERVVLPASVIEMPIEARAIERGGRTRKLTFLEEIHAIVPAENIEKMAMAAMSAGNAHVKALKDKKDQLKAAGNANKASFVEAEKEVEESSEDKKNFGNIPNWFDGLVDLSKPLAAGFN